MQDYRKYLQPEVVSRLGSIELKAKMIVEGFITGLHKSPYHGFSVEFAEHRQYTFGDEPRHIDWRVYGRTGKYYIKQYEEETNLRCYILLNQSSSMSFHSSKSLLPKVEYASYIAAALTLLMMGQRDAVSLATYSNTLHTFLPPSLKPSHQNLILQTLHQTSQATQQARHQTTDTSAALKDFAKHLSKRSLIILLSDFWDTPEKVAAALKHFQHQHNEVLAFHILDPKEKTFDFATDVEVIDLETGERLFTSPRQLQAAYQAALQARTRTLQQALVNSGIDYVAIDTAQPFNIALLAYLKKRHRIF
ncbi:MAG: DUF58 domain-containing protein [Chloroherpetonaceae bacterium]|nr:DUF58 domain-containing protein [Chloroherpetonaceae bacterium]